MPCSTYSFKNLDTLNTQNTLWSVQKVGKFQRLASQVVKAFVRLSMRSFIIIQVLLKTYALEFKTLNKLFKRMLNYNICIVL